MSPTKRAIFPTATLDTITNRLNFKLLRIIRDYQAGKIDKAEATKRGDSSLSEARIIADKAVKRFTRNHGLTSSDTVEDALKEAEASWRGILDDVQLSDMR